ncbi:MAG: nucleotidyltransferase family protein, partial [Gammaproteobacteria bacterium]|nr:nucleotidyltransferase family protein [Gammaproteobacteria bacterium]
MGRLDDYRSALLVADPAVSDAALEQVLEGAGPDFDLFVIDHGLGPSWHERTGHAEFRDSRLTAEALYLAQESALRDIDAALNAQGIAYVLIKGGATRLALYDNPALRACHDLDLLVCPDDRVRAASVLVDTGFRASPESKSISRELVLSRGDVDIDLHWGLLREGRLRFEDVPAMLARRERSHGTWMLSAGDAL